jgi:hypothetical protein
MRVCYFVAILAHEEILACNDEHGFSFFSYSDEQGLINVKKSLSGS